MLTLIDLNIKKNGGNIMDVKEYLTPYKYKKSIISPKENSFSSKGVDCPFLFRHNGKFYMMHIGFDGIGYQTALCTSDDLIHWQEEGVILKRGCHKEWDKVGMAGVWILKDCDLYGTNELIKVDGKYWLFYHSYPNEGYENGAAKVGLAYTEDENLLDWNFVDEPIFVPCDDGTWDSGGLYKTSVIRYDDKYYMFYNAKDMVNGPWKEQTGVAVSTDMLHWERYENNPLLPTKEGTWMDKFVSDPCITYDSKNKLWALFFFAYDSHHAREGVATGKDFFNLQVYDKPIIDVGKHGEIDSTHAHKPGIIYHNGALWHFYCSVRPTATGDERKSFGSEYRCITVARSTPF